MDSFKIGELNNTNRGLAKQMTFFGDAITVKQKKILVWQHQRRRFHWGRPFMPNDPPPLMQEDESGQFVKKLNNLDECELDGWHWASDQWKTVPFPDADASGWMYCRTAFGTFGKKSRWHPFRKRLWERAVTQSLRQQNKQNIEQMRGRLRRSTRALIHGAGPGNSVLQFVVYETEQLKKGEWEIPTPKELHYTNTDDISCSFEEFTLDFEDDDFGTWGWAETWKIYRDDETDDNGWLYARQSTSFNTRAKAPATANEVLKWRRRKWIRSAVFQPKGNRRNLVTSTMNEQLASLLWHVYLCCQQATFCGENQQWDVNGFEPRDAEFDHEPYFAEDGRTQNLHRFSERFSILWLNTHDQFFNGERARRRMKISNAMGIYGDLLNGTYVRTNKSIGPTRKHDIYRNRDVDKNEKIDHAVFLWFDEENDMWTISTEEQGGKILAYCEGEDVLPCSLNDDWVVLNDPQHFAPKSLVENLPEHIPKPKKERYQVQKTFHIMACDIMNVFHKYSDVHKEKYSESWMNDEVAARSFSLVKRIMKSLIKEASFRDTERTHYEGSKAEEFVEAICDVALLYSYILSYHLTKIKVQGLVLVACLLESTQLGDSHPLNQVLSPLGTIEFLHDKSDRFQSDFMSRAMFSPDVLNTCENLLNLLEQLDFGDFGEENTGAEEGLLEECMTSIHDITCHMLRQYHDPDIEEGTIINLIVCYRASKKLAQGKKFDQKAFNDDLGRTIQDSALHYYNELKSEFHLELDEFGFFKNYPGFSKAFPRFYEEMGMIVERDVIHRSKRLFDRGVFGEKFVATGVVSLLEGFSGDVAYQVVQKKENAPFTNFHLTLLRGVGFIIDKTKCAFERLGENVTFYHEQNKNPNQLFPWQHEVVSAFMEDWVKSSLEKIMRGFERQVKDPVNFVDRKGESYLYSPCIIEIFTILESQIEAYFKLLNEFPSIACESDKKFFGGLHKCFLQIDDWIRDTTFAIKSEKQFNKMFESEGWFRVEESTTFQESIKVPKKPMEQYMEDFNCNCCRLMSLNAMTMKLKSLKKVVIKNIISLEKPHDLQMPMLDTARSFLDHMTASHQELQEWLSRMLAAVLIHVQSDDIMSKVYTTDNKRESNLLDAHTEIFTRMEDVLYEAKERLDPDRYVLFGESLQIVFDEAMFHLLTHRESNRMFVLKDNHWLRADYREFKSFFDEQEIGHRDNRWIEVLKIMELSTTELKEQSENRTSGLLDEPLSLVRASRQINTTTPLFLVLAHRNDPDAKAFVKKIFSKSPAPPATRPRGSNNFFNQDNGSIQLPRVSTNRDRIRNQLKVSRSPPYRFTLIIHQCRDILGVDRNGKSDPYVKIKCRKTVKHTPVIKKSVNPVYNYEFTCRIPEGFFEHPDQELEVELKLKDWNRLLKKKKIGSLFLRFKKKTGADEQWKQWRKPDGGEDLEGKHGRIQYSAFFTDLRAILGPATVLF